MKLNVKDYQVEPLRYPWPRQTQRAAPPQQATLPDQIPDPKDDPRAREIEAAIEAGFIAMDCGE